MYEKVAQPIDVLVAFHKERVEPMTFKWGGRYYQVKKINLVHSEGHGRERTVFFSVSDEANAYRLSYATESMRWHLEEMATL